jgi:hypothetical protein
MTPALRLRPEHGVDGLRRTALAVGLAATLGCALGALLDPAQFLRSYLVAYVFWVGLALGCLAVLMIHYVTGGAWGGVLRRLLESGTRTLPLMAVLFVPLASGVDRLYGWARPEALAHDPLLRHKAVYLNVPFFLGRAAVYFAAWILVARFLNRWSLEQDDARGAGPTRRLELLSQGGLVVLGLTMTFAAIDWMMSLEPHWFSTIYGVLFMGGSVLSAFAFVIPVAALLVRRGALATAVTPEHFHDLGKLLLAFVMLWAYFALAQFLIIWAGNLPEETPWYLARLRGGWEWLALGLVVFHFALPFAVLLSREVKRHAARLALVAALVVLVRVADVFWLVAPAFHPGALRVHPLDALTFLGLGGLWVATYLRQLATRPLLPLNDPSLAADR